MPRLLRDRVVQLEHEGHQGIVKTKYRLRSKVWWPGMDKDVETFVKFAMAARSHLDLIVLSRCTASFPQALLDRTV